MNYELIFSDFDGTLTVGNDMSPIFFDLLTFLDKKNVPLIIITGRSISWSHFFLSHFPQLSYVISEGGGAISYRGAKHRIINEFLISNEEMKLLAHVSSLLKENFPNLELSADSLGRVTDRAIELEDLSDPSYKSEIENFLASHKISFSTSNVHLNFWAGKISKYESSQTFLKKFFPSLKNDDCLFFGDSLNDESMFKGFKNSVGVSNISGILDQLKSHPQIILKGIENQGIHGVYNFLTKEN